MTRITIAAVAFLLVNLCTSSHGQEVRRSLRHGVAESDYSKNGESKLDSEVIASTTMTAQPNSFYDLEAFTAKEVSNL